jgi:hypothetical protein
MDTDFHLNDLHLTVRISSYFSRLYVKDNVVDTLSGGPHKYITIDAVAKHWILPNNLAR